MGKLWDRFVCAAIGHDWAFMSRLENEIGAKAAWCSRCRKIDYVRVQDMSPKDTEIEEGDVYYYDDQLAVVISVELDESETRALSVTVRVGDEIKIIHPRFLKVL